ncbi:poly-gamma-glutamate system protein [Calycomorphotria hydatis]|uniref:Poly-gamma-glutamate system protein n=1 Tax=Calycomorphotria hydatis TaxID=2528027 RepID=A0A517T717_9PLAN|nr:poly-gamma-glutamate system protein [Calycomorphotria hydatis]QDT64171.1 hypothetical protein V22_14020 [Calycomorphotria hydatis]
MNRRIYWRPRSVSRNMLLLIALWSVLGVVATETIPYRARQKWYEEKLAAAQLSEKCMNALKEERLLREHPIDLELDPRETGMVGLLMSPVTTISGHLSAKQTSVNPNFAAVLIDMLRRAGVKKGDAVAVGCSGSFPALNVSVFAALQTMQAKPVIIASGGASQFGANFEDWLWIDMETTLREQGLIDFKAVACSIGGYEDVGMGMSDEARALVVDAIDRNELKLIKSESFGGAIEERMDVYTSANRGEPYKAYINVGGGTISVGRSLGKKLYSPGLNLTAPATATRIDSIMSRFMRNGVPVIHLVQIEELALKYGLPIAPLNDPKIGEGSVFYKSQYMRWIAVVVLVGIVISLQALILTDVGARLFKARSPKSTGAAEQMV